MKNPKNSKERNLIKGALRRCFSRSELRKEALESATIPHTDPNRPRVTKWGVCQECGEIVPRYLMEVDHHDPVVPLDTAFEDITTWDEVVDRMWCHIKNLRPLCEGCHDRKSKAENQTRRAIKKLKGVLK